MSTSKQLWVLAGGNGAGKSTFYQQFLAPARLPFVNADILAHQLDAENTEAVSYKAAALAAKLRTQLLQSGNTSIRPCHWPMWPNSTITHHTASPLPLLPS